MRILLPKLLGDIFHLLEAVLQDPLAGDDADKDAAVVDNGHKILV